MPTLSSRFKWAEIDGCARVRLGTSDNIRFENMYHINITDGFESPTDFGPQGPLGNALLHKFAVATEELNPPHTYVPWIVIDGDSSEVSE